MTSICQLCANSGHLPVTGHVGFLPTTVSCTTGVEWPCSQRPASDLEGIDLQVLPPRLLVASLMHLPMMPTAERYGELIADFKTDRPRLGKAQMVRIGRLPPANQTRL